MMKQQTEESKKEEKEEKDFHKESLSDIVVNKDEYLKDDKHKYDMNFIICSNENWKKQFSRSNFGIPEASEIIPSWLYLGCKIDISNKTVLQKLGITHILNVSDNIPCYFPNDYIYAQIKVDDIPSNNIEQYFDAATQFIDTINPKYNKNNIDHHLKLFVHCAVGKSRSSTIIIQYLMRRGINFNNNKWLEKIEQFKLMDNFINDDRIYKRSLNCFNINNTLCCQCCICWFKCCLCCNCCNEQNIDMQYLQTNDDDDDDIKIECDDKYTDWKTISNIGTMSYRNSCDYVQKCRDIICPNESFATQLAIFEEHLRNNIPTFELCYAWKHNGIKPKRSYQYKNNKVPC